MASVANRKAQLGIHLRANVAAAARGLRERKDGVEFAHGARGFEQCRTMRLQLGLQLRENLQLQFLETGLRRENLALEFLQRGRREALGANQRLLALVVRRRAVQMRLGNLDVVSEDLIV